MNPLFFGLVFVMIGGMVAMYLQAAPGLCSTTGVIGTGTYQVTAPQTAQYRLWVRMQVPDTTNTSNTNGVRVELAGGSNQCMTVTTTASNAVNQWQWVNSDATASGIQHVTSSLPAGNYTAKILGMKPNVKVDKVLLIKSDDTCVPDNVKSGTRQPGDNCTTPEPTVSISASPTSVQSGSPSTLTWSSTNATSCTASNGWSGAKATSGNQSTGNLTTATTYTLSCTGIGGDSSASTTVNVTAAPAPSINLSANPTSVVTGSPSTLTWTSTNATSCTASNGWSGTKATSGSQSTGNLSATTNFTLHCTGPGGTTNRSVSVTVTSAPPPADTTPPTVTFSLPGFTITPGQSAVLIQGQKGVIWEPLASDASGIRSTALTVNGQTVNGSQIAIGDTANGDYVVRAVVTDNAGLTTTVSLTVRVRYPDFNRSGAINIQDVSALLNRWGTASTIYDINGNGKVDLPDLSYALNRWGPIN